MSDEVTSFLAIVLIIMIIIGLFKGALKTFQRNWVAALILLLLLTPIWIMWALVEVFTGDIVKQAVAQPSTHNVNVSVVNQAPGTTSYVSDKRTNDRGELVETKVYENVASNSDEAMYLVSPDIKDCPFCAEPIRQNAVFCRYCKRDVPV